MGKTVQINATFDEDLLKTFDRLCKLRVRSRSGYLALLMRKEIERKKDLLKSK